MKKNVNKIIKIFIFCTFIVGIIFVSKFLFYNDEELLISSYNIDGKSNIVKMDMLSKNKKELIANRDVWLSGDLSDDKKYLTYMDAISNEPWQVFLLNLKSKKNYEVTTDNYKKFRVKYGTKDVIYFETFKSGLDPSKIVRINMKNRISKIFDTSNTDRSFGAYDVRNNKIIVVSVSNSENNKRLKITNENNTSLKPIIYSIYEMNEDGSNIKKIGNINAQFIRSISYNYDCKKAIICGKEINNEKGNCIFEIYIDNGEVKKLLTDTMISKQKNSDVKVIGSNGLGVICKNEQKIYFAGVPKNSKVLNFQSVSSFPTRIYSYNFYNHEMKEIYKCEKSSIITDLTVSY